MTAAALVHLLRCVLDTRGTSGAEGPGGGTAPSGIGAVGVGVGGARRLRLSRSSPRGQGGRALRRKRSLCWTRRATRRDLAQRREAVFQAKGSRRGWEIPEPWEKFHLTGQPG